MISSITIQTAYQHLYKQLRNYLWPFDTVEIIAELEIACYQAIPNLYDIRNTFQRLHKEFDDALQEDAELQKSVTEFEDLIYSNETAYLVLRAVKEVSQ